MKPLQEKTQLLIFGAGIILICVIYFFCITFIKVSETGEKYADVILGFLGGSGFTALVSYWFGSSKGSQDKSETMKTMVKEPPCDPGSPPVG